MNNQKRNKKILIAVLAGVGLLLTTIGATVAWFTYAKSGQKGNTITTGSIKFHYQEESRIIDVDDMMPMTDEQGMDQDDYFDFTITAETSRTVDIPYYITVRRTADSYADLDSSVKVYLTKVDIVNNEEEETQVALSKFGSLSHYENGVINIPLTEKALYNDTVIAGTQSYTQKYRLRIWVDTSANYLVQTPVPAYCTENTNNTTVAEIDSQPATAANCTGENYTWHPADVQNSYPLNDKEYALIVNVYGEGNDIGEAAKANRENTDISSMSIGNNAVTATDGNNFSTSMEVASASDIPTSIEIDTVNPGATVTVEKLTALGDIDKSSNIKRLSTQVTLPDLGVGTNNYRITVTSADRSNTETYNLTIVISLTPDPVSFSTDSWKTIVNAIRNNNTSLYQIGDTKSITLGGGLGSHTIRISNKSACTAAQTSETTCGFVLEFADILTTMQANSTAFSAGYPSSAAFNYINDTVVPAMPDDLKPYILNTTVISSSSDSGQTFTTPNQKLYLLDLQEVFGNNNSRNTAYTSTRQLQYYSTNTAASAKIKKYSGTDTEWWTRTMKVDYPNALYFVSESGYDNDRGVQYVYGISPAFRIGYVEQ